MIPLVILAGGRGTRLGSLSQELPKFLMPVSPGRVFADVQLDWVRAQGFREVVLCVGWRGDLIRAHVGEGRRYGLHVSYVDDGAAPLGTGGALRRAFASPPSGAAVLYGDTVLDVPCAEVVAAARGRHALMTVIEAPPGETPNAEFRDGLVCYDKRRPAPGWRQMDYGLSVVSRDFVLALPESVPYDLADGLATASAKGLLAGYLATRPFHEINTPEALAAFRKRFAKGKTKGLIILDRDGVLNRHVVDPEQGTIDSPLHPSQVEMIPGVAEALARIAALGYGLAIATNQPAAAKGKTTLKNLHAVHAAVVAGAEAAGARISSSHLCLHRQEDGCSCRKPKTGLLEEALSANPGYDRRLSWMVGDGVTDVQAGRGAGLKTVFLGRKRCDSCRILDVAPPDAWLESLGELAAVLGR